MSVIVPRTCTVIADGDAQSSRAGHSRPLEEFRSTPAYVLLGDPGSGKSTAFETEYEEVHEDASPVSARIFRARRLDCHPEWRAKTLFIDGLDEIRAGSPDAHAPLDEICERLDALGRPRFRLSCREADWLGANDWKHLKDVSPNSKVVILRLDPLTDADVVRILNGRPDIDDAEDFIASARKKGVDSLLTNPLTLDLLACVVAQENRWPEGRREVFEAACLEMAREHNEEHRLATRAILQGALPDAGELVEAAGRLCAVQLIAGLEGYALRDDSASGDHPAVDWCEYKRPDRLRAALSTKLFKAVRAGEGLFDPVHRHIAEFLAARHLAGLIGDVLPVSRVLALITGDDGIVVTEQRGLSAWLAAHCRKARNQVIERDPIGVALYGDIREFSAGEKRKLLACLHREASRLDSAFGAAAAFGPLASPEAEEEIREILLDPRRDVAHQQFVGFVLRVLACATPLPRLGEVLLDILRDESWLPYMNELALDAFLHNCDRGVECNFTGELREVLADVRAGTVPDPDREMLGTLLAHLYPDTLPPSEIWNYLYEADKSPPLFGGYFRFWKLSLPESSSDIQVAKLLDTLSARLGELRPALESYYLHDVPVELLARGLEVFGDERSAEHLCTWLHLGVITAPRHRPRAKRAMARIRNWLENRPEVQKAVISEALRRWAELDGSSRGRLNVAQHLHGARPPADFGHWCLEQAVASAQRGECTTARYLLERAVEAVEYRRNDDGLSLEVLEERTRGLKNLAGMLSAMLVCPLDDDYFAHRHEMRSYEEEGQRERQRWLETVRSNESALRGNRGNPWLLHNLASIYFAYDIDAEGDDPVARIEHSLFDDKGLIETALGALRATINRDDVPDIEETMRLSRSNRIPLVALPYLAGLAEIERTSPDESCRFDESRMSKALAFLCAIRLEERPEWYRRLLLSHPEFVAAALVRIVVARLRAGVEHILPLYDLTDGDDHAQVARFACLPLLKTFPLRSKSRQLEALGCLLWAALRHACRERFTRLIASKLSRTSMNAGQRVRWLAAGVAASPKVYVERLDAFVHEGRESRIRHLAAFLVQFDLSPLLVEESGVPALSLFIRLSGRSFGPSETQASGRAHDFIQRLAGFAGKEASDALEALASDDTLAHWRDILVRARDRQRVIRRDATYRHPDIAQVCQTLNHAAPANAGDLAALVVDRLDEIAERIRSVNSNDWRPYWNEDQHRRPTEPKHESSCRDALLSKLRELLPREVDAQPEGRYVNDKRADIRVNVACGGFQVPVEMKKSSNPTLWNALRNQLIERYTRDSATGGYGIYLVFWFGNEHMPRAPAGARPASASELRRCLKSTLSDEEARKISVVVVDVTPPR